MTHEIKVLTARGFHNINLNGDEGTTFASVVEEIGKNPDTCVVRADGVLISDLSATVDADVRSLSVFETKQVATAGAKGGSKGS